MPLLDIVKTPKNNAAPSSPSLHLPTPLSERFPAREADVEMQTKKMQQEDDEDEEDFYAPELEKTHDKKPGKKKMGVKKSPGSGYIKIVKKPTKKMGVKKSPGSGYIKIVKKPT